MGSITTSTEQHKCTHPLYKQEQQRSRRKQKATDTVKWQASLLRLKTR